MSSTASLTITATVSGLPEGQQRVNIPLINSTSAGGLISLSSVSTGSSVAVKTALNVDTMFLLITPPSTYTFPIRLMETTGDIGVALSSVNPSLLSVVGGSTIGLYTTGGSVIAGVRLIQW